MPRSDLTYPYALKSGLVLPSKSGAYIVVVNEDGSGVVHDIRPQYGDPHYPIRLFLSDEVMLDRGISRQRLTHLRRNLVDLFSQVEAWELCTIHEFLASTTQRDLTRIRLTKAEVALVVNLFAEYGYDLHDQVLPRDRGLAED